MRRGEILHDALGIRIAPDEQQGSGHPRSRGRHAIAPQQRGQQFGRIAHHRQRDFRLARMPDEEARPDQTQRIGHRPDLQAASLDARSRHPLRILIQKQRGTERQREGLGARLPGHCDDLARHRRVTGVQQQRGLRVQAVALAEALGQVAGKERPERCIPGRRVASILGRIGADVPTLHHLSQEAGRKQRRPVLVAQVGGLDDPMVLVLQAPEVPQRLRKKLSPGRLG